MTSWAQFPLDYKILFQIRKRISRRHSLFQSIYPSSNNNAHPKILYNFWENHAHRNPHLDTLLHPIFIHTCRVLALVLLPLPVAFLFEAMERQAPTTDAVALKPLSAAYSGYENPAPVTQALSRTSAGLA